MRLRWIVPLFLAACWGAVPDTAHAPARPQTPPGVEVQLPQAAGALRFAVIGDSGTGDKAQYDLAQVLLEAYHAFPFEFVLMLGDNIYGRREPEDFRSKFEVPYQPLIDAGVKFYAVLGNHDDPSERSYKLFNMNGERYYTFSAREQSVRFFALDSNYLDPAQLAWLDHELSSAKESWKIGFFHHPPYSSGKFHGPDNALRSVLEPYFLRYGVDLVLSGHEHFYERMKPQHGVLYFISGAAGQLRRDNIRRDQAYAAGYDQGHHFMLFEIDGDELQFQVISEDGRTVDSGVWRRPGNGNQGSTAPTGSLADH